MAWSKWERAGMRLLLCVCVAGWIAFSTVEAFAVAGKFTSAPPGVALSGGELTLELDEPVNGQSTVTVPVTNGAFTTPAGVDKQNIRTCRYTNDKGETTAFDCGAYLAFGAGAAATGAAAATSGWTAPTMRDPSAWAFDATAFVGGTGSIGSKDATTTGTGTAAGQGTSGLDGLAGATYGLMLRAHLPLKLTGALGDIWGFVRWNQHSGRDGHGGSANLHNPVPGNESSTSLKRYADIEIGVGKSFETYCPENGPCHYFGAYAGYSLQRTKISTSTNEIVTAPTFEDTKWNSSVVTGAWYQIPLAGIGTGFEAYSFVFGVDFRRVPCMSVSGPSPTFPNTSYRGTTEEFWEYTGWGGINVSF